MKYQLLDRVAFYIFLLNSARSLLASQPVNVSPAFAVSHRFYLVFSAPLYANTVDSPLKPPQSLSLMKTLSDARTLSWKQHPALLFRQLALTHSEGSSSSDMKNIKGPADLLKNTYRLLPGAEGLRGSVLRCLHWYLMVGLDELNKILGAPGDFLNFRELPQLKCIEICVLGDTAEWNEGLDSSPCCEDRDCGRPGIEFWLLFSPPGVAS